MWGDPQRAAHLDQSDTLAGLLLQVTGPAHIPWNDPRWQELLHGYDVWVHIESSSDDVVPAACASLAKHAATSSNLAALALHVARMVRDVEKSVINPGDEQQQGQHQSNAMSHDFTRRVALVGKARATAGSLRLLRILLHDIVVATSKNTKNELNNETVLEEMFVYRSRDISERGKATERDAARELISSLLSFLSCMGNNSNTAMEGKSPMLQLTLVPELYDATVFGLELFLVLISSQLYHPMISSSQRCQNHQRSHRKNSNLGSTHKCEVGDNYFLDRIMAEAKQRQDEQRDNQRKHLNDPLGEMRQSELAKNAEEEPLVNKSEAIRLEDDVEHYKMDWTPQTVLKACLVWLIKRPSAPARSIAHHNAELAESVVQAKGEKIGPDGMYENFKIVTAAKVDPSTGRDNKDGYEDGGKEAHRNRNVPSKVIIDATKGVLVLSSSLIMLPFRLMSLALGLWGYRYKHQPLLGGSSGSSGHDQFRMIHLQSSTSGARRRTNDVLWLTDSPVADLGCALFLLLTNNHRTNSLEENGVDNQSVARTNTLQEGNPFRLDLASLNDDRWEGSDNMESPPPSDIDPLGHPATNGIASEGQTGELEGMGENFQQLSPQKKTVQRQLLATNFESLFEAFGITLHTEVGALLLYTVLQSSPIFAASVAVRSDLDTLILPLLRTLYFSSSQQHYTSQDYGFGKSAKSHGNGETPDGVDAQQQALFSVRSCPFRSPSQLYVILILLLLFSQDASFGPDAFRRVKVSNIVWYKERNLRDINLGSVLLLTLLRCITFNLNRLHDAFLLSNCCAVLMNLSPNIVNLHEYAAMRLATVTMSAMKRYAKLVAQSGGKVHTEEDITSKIGMYGEVSRTLLRLVRHCLRTKNIDKNLHLVYALVYHQADFHSVISKKNSPFTSAEIGSIDRVITKAASLIQQDGDARTAPKAFQLLENSVDLLKTAALSGQPSSSSSSRLSKSDQETDSSAASSSGGSNSSGILLEDTGDFTFTYEEEADPEIFFIPYVWEVIVCAVTAGTIDWDSNHIQVFPLLEIEDELLHGDPNNTVEELQSSMAAGAGEGQFASDVSDVV